MIYVIYSEEWLLSTILLKMKIINNLNGIMIGIQLHVKYHIYFIYHYYSAAVYVDVALLHVFFLCVCSGCCVQTYRIVDLNMKFFFNLLSFSWNIEIFSTFCELIWILFYGIKKNPSFFLIFLNHLKGVVMSTNRK